MNDNFSLQSKASKPASKIVKRALSTTLLCLLILGISACEKIERVVESHPNGLRKTVHIYEGDQWVELKTYHMNNIRATSVGIQDSKRHGPFTRWSTNGVKMETGEFTQGDSSGLWSKFLSRTEKISEGRYENGRKQGTWKEYWPQGIVKSESQWDKGVQVGEVREWFYDSTLKVIHNCHENGTHKEFYYNGKLRYEYDCDAQFRQVGAFKEYDLLGHLLREARFNKNGIKDSTWTWYNARGEVLHERRYQDGVLDGVQKIGDQEFSFDKGNGQLRYPCVDSLAEKLYEPHHYKDSILRYLIQGEKPTCADTTFVRGLADGTSYTFNPDKHLKVEQWKLGAKQWQDKYRIAKKWRLHKVSEGGFENNLREGEWKVFGFNGKVTQRLNFEKDHYMGDQLFYDSTGALTMKKHYKGKNHKVLVEIIDSDR